MKKKITLEEILDPVPVQTFFKEYWGKKHLILRRNKFKNLFTFDNLSDYINRYPFVKSLQVIDYDDKDGKFCLDKSRSGKDKTEILSKNKIANLWSKGKSFVIPFAEYENKDLVDMCFEFERYFKQGQVNVYASPSAGSKSYPAHGDATENFLFHTKGKVKWTIYKESIPDKPETILEEFTLDEGDMLYIPQYQYHKVDAIGPRILCSIHFSNKDKQSLEAFKISSLKDNKRAEWFDFNPTKTIKKIIKSVRFPINSQKWKTPYFKNGI